MLLTTAIRRSLNVSLKSIYSGGSSRSLAILAPATDSQQSPLADPKKVEKANSTKHEISFEFHEHCKSGSDSEAAELTNTAYGKNTPKPHEQMVAAAEESKKLGHASNPLDVSSANPLASEVRDSSLEGNLRDQQVQSQGTVKGVTIKQGHCKKYG